MKNVLMIILTIFFIFACSMPETKIYSIYVSVDSKRLNGKTDNSITIVVHAPRYLTQPYIAYRESPYQLKISRYSKWDASPNEIVREGFKDSLSSTEIFQDVRTSSTVPRGLYSLRVNLKRFERYDEGQDSFGELLMDVDLLSPEMKVLYQNTISKRVKLDDRSFLSLAKVLSSALTEGIHEIMSNILRFFSRKVANNR
ncbi:MAG: ABC-type transport auxiliary lipoprotein family protein [Thermodesulfovibrionales bacterium]